MRAALLLCFALCGCSSFGANTCASGLKPATTAELYFGRNIGAEEGVSDSDWQRFVETDIAPRFPEGFTVSDASGTWRDRDGVLGQERTKLLRIVISPGDQPKLDAIRTTYKQRFRQESVLLVETEGCAGF